jgi:gas vesicle protein
MSDRENSNVLSTLSAFAFGAALGAGAMYFFAPRSGKDNRALVKARVEELQDYIEDEKEALSEKIEEIFGEVNQITTALYKDARRLWDSQVAAFEKSLKKIDKKAYQEMVDNVMERLQTNKRYDNSSLSKVKRYLTNQWHRFSEALDS